MGAAKNAKNEAADKRRTGGGSRGSVNNNRRLEVFAARGPSSRGDWGECDASWLQSAIVEITRLGGAITFGLSRDGGAHFVALLLDNERETLWFNRDADLDSELEVVVETLRSMD